MELKELKQMLGNYECSMDCVMRYIARDGYLSPSSFQRYMRIGYNRAIHILDYAVERGVLAPRSDEGKYKVLDNQTN